MDRYSTTEWLRIATAGIVSPKERAAAKQELEDHIAAGEFGKRTGKGWYDYSEQ